jgi:hypothetical protein
MPYEKEKRSGIDGLIMRQCWKKGSRQLRMSIESALQIVKTEALEQPRSLRQGQKMLLPVPVPVSLRRLASSKRIWNSHL